METAKAWAAAIGSTCVAITTAMATVQIVLDDGALDAGEYGSLATAAVVLVGTVYAVWRTPNRPTGVEPGTGHNTL